MIISLPRASLEKHEASHRLAKVADVERTPPFPVTRKVRLAQKDQAISPNKKCYLLNFNK
jgi:hypothetical protein